MWLVNDNIDAEFQFWVYQSVELEDKFKIIPLSNNIHVEK